MNYACSQGSDNISGKHDQSNHNSDKGVSQQKYFVITVTITSNPTRDYNSTNFFAMIMSLKSMVRVITTMIRVFTSSDQGLDLCCFCCHRMLRGDSSCDILKNPYRKILNHREDNNTWLSVDR